MPRRIVPWIVALVPALGLGGCASPGPVNNPIASSLTWFSYVGGEDLRRDCLPGQPARFRLVYNGRYKEQVRSYDLTLDPSGGRSVLQSRVTGARSVSVVDLRNPFAPWEPAFHERLLTPDQTRSLVRAIQASGFDRPAPDGTFLRSDGYYWVASACRDGRFHFMAWAPGEADLHRLAFVPELLRLDESRIAYNLPARIDLPLYGGGYDPTEPDTIPFRLEVGRNGLRGVP